MTEKRFSVKQRQGATNYSITDYYGELPLSEGIYYKSNANKLCKWLNTQHELLNALHNENEQLKSIKKFADRNGICIFNIDEAFRRCWQDNAKLVKENEELKEKLNEILELTEMTGMIHLRKAEIKSIIKR